MTDKFWERWIRPSEAPFDLFNAYGLSRKDYRQIYTRARVGHEQNSISFLDMAHARLIKQKLKGV